MSSSNCPPQLHLTLPPNATSFKRSFEQFGFDLDSPIGADAGSSSGSSSSGSDRNDRSKRARSASNSSRGDTDESSSSGNSSSSFRSGSEDSALSSSRSLASNPSATHLHAMNSYLQPPRLPTPDLPDVEMADYPLGGLPGPVAPPTPPPVITTRDDLFRLSLDRLGGFENESLGLRESRIHAVRSPTPPPTLPPLVLTSVLADGRLNPNPGFPASRSESSALADSLYHIDLPISSRLQAAGRHPPASFNTFTGISSAPRTMPHELRGTEGLGQRDHNASSPASPVFIAPQETGIDSQDGQGARHWSFGSSYSHHLSAPGPEPFTHESTSFRHRLDSALDILRSQSPLFTDHEDQPSPVRHDNPEPFTLPDLPPSLQDTSWEAPWLDLPPSSRPYSLADEGRHHSRTVSASHSREDSIATPAQPPYLFPTFDWRDRRSERENDSRERNGLAVSSSTGTRDPALTARTTLERARQIQHETDTLLDELRSMRNSAARTLDRADPRPGTAAFIDHGLWDPTEDEGRSVDNRVNNVHVLRRGTFSSHPSDVRPSPRRSLLDDLEGNASSNLESSRSNWLRRRSQLLRLEIQRRTSSNSDVPSNWRLMNDESNVSGSRSFNNREPHPTPPTRERPHDPNRTRRAMPHLTLDTNLPRPSRLQMPNTHDLESSTSLRPTQRFGQGARSTTNSVAPESAGTRRPWTRPRTFSQLFQDSPESPLITNDDEDSSDRSRWSMLDDDTQDEHSPFAAHTTRSTPNYLAGWGRPDYTSLDRPGTQEEPTSNESRNPSSRHVARSWRFTTTSEEPVHLGSLHVVVTTGGVDIRQEPPESADVWEDSHADGGVSPSTPGTPWFSSSFSASHSPDLAYPSRESHASSVRRIEPLPSPPPRPTFTPVIPDISTFFERFADLEDVGPGSQPERPSTSRARSRSSLSDYNTFRLPSPAPVRPPPPARDPRPPSPPTRNTSFHLPTDNQASVYRNINLNAYHDGTFRTSLQRFIELDRVRSRTNRSEETANQTAPGSSVPPSLPPLRFESPTLNINAGPPPHGVMGPSTPSESHSSNAGLGYSTSRPTGSRPSRVGSSALDDILRQTWRRRVPPSISANRDNWHSSVTSQHHQPPRRSDEDRQTRREPHTTFSGSRRHDFPATETTEPPRRGQAAGFAHAIDVLRRDGLSDTSQQLFVEQFRRESSQERRPFVNWGDIDGMTEGRMMTAPDVPPRRRTLPRRVPEMPRHPPVPDTSASRTNYGMSNTASRRRRPSRSPTRDDNHGHERFTMRSRFRGLRPWLLPDRDLLLDDLPSLDFSPGRRSRNLGDYIRDEDFDSSYESLLSLAASVGEVKPRCVPEHVIASLPSGVYKDWASAESDKRCPICLDDYKSLDPVLKLWDCSHWLHKDCLEQWLRGASTCPVCRRRVKESGPGPSGSGRSGNGGGGGGGGGSSGSSNGHGHHGLPPRFSAPPPWRG